MPATTKYTEFGEIPSIIYGLFDPFTGEIRYVGKTTKSLEDRWKTHIRYANSSNTAKNCWIRSCIAKGEYPYIEQIDSGVWDLRTVNSREIYWIKVLTSKANLKNGTTGGDGGAGQVVSVETRAALATKAKAAWTDPAYRMTLESRREEYWDGNDAAKLAVSHQSKGRWSDPEYKARKTFESPEYRAARSKLAKEISESPKMLKVLADNGAKSMLKRRRCAECPYEGAPAHLGSHQKRTQHTKYFEIESSAK